MLALTLLGCLALAPRGDDIDQGYALYYSPVAALQALFDLALVAEYLSRLHGRSRAGSSKDSVDVLRVVLAVICPIVELLSAIVCCFLQKTSTGVSERTSLLSMSSGRNPPADHLLESAEFAPATRGHVFKGRPRKLADWLQPEA